VADTLEDIAALSTLDPPKEEEEPEPEPEPQPQPQPEEPPNVATVELVEKLSDQMRLFQVEADRHQWTLLHHNTFQALPAYHWSTDLHTCSYVAPLACLLASSFTNLLTY
jgi:hypothetical protein